MKKMFVTGFMVLICFCLIGPLFAFAAPVGKITRLEGKVDVLKTGQRAVAGVSLGDNVDVGDIYRAKTNSRAEITFLNKNILRIYPATRVQISQYSDDGTRSNQVMKMDRGKVDAASSEEFVKRVSSFAEGNKFEVHTPNAVAGIRGSGMTVGFAQTITGLFFSRGFGYFYNPNQPGVVRNVSAGFVSFIVGTGGMPSRPVPGNASYIGGSGGSAPGAGGAAGTGTNLNIQVTNLAASVDQIYVFTPPPVVPYVLVGCVPSLSGTETHEYGYISISFNNVKFYGPSMTGMPQSWQAESVTGSVKTAYWAPQHYHEWVPMMIDLSGGGMSAFLTGPGPTSNSTWTGIIANGSAPDGVGRYTSPFTFSGTASGTFSETVIGEYSYSTLSGTASGVVPSQQQVAVPNVYVGSIPTLSGEATGNGGLGSIAITLSNVKFYGTAAGGAPQNWRYATVNGSFNTTYANNYLGVSVPLSGSGNSATFTLVSSDTHYQATITNGSAPNGISATHTKPVTFSGGSGGTYSAATGTLSGYAAGSAR